MNTATNPASTLQQLNASTLPHLTPLHDGRPGLRTLLHVSATVPPLPPGEGRGEGQPDPSSPLPPLPPIQSPSGPCLDFIASTDTLDRYHEIIDPAGWHLDTYRRNPVFQNAHNYGDILFTLGKALVTEVRLGAPTRPAEESERRRKRSEGGAEGSYLFQRIEFATDVNPIARIAYGLYKGGFLNAVSVGFIPLRWEDAPQSSSFSSSCSFSSSSSSSSSFPSSLAARKLGEGGPRRKYLEQELLEVSAVAIPANPDALALAVKSGAVPKSDLRETLDLLRALTVDYGPWSPPRCVPRQSITPTFHQSTTLAFARTLRNILKHT